MRFEIIFGHFIQKILGENLLSFSDRNSYSHFERCCLTLHTGNTVVAKFTYLNKEQTNSYKEATLVSVLWVLKMVFSVIN